MADNTNRRTFLALAGSSAAIALAGCGSTGGTNTTTDGMDDQMTESEQMTEQMTEAEMMEGPVTLTVRIENVASTEFYGADTSTGGAVWITPGAYALHSANNPLFTPGEEASIGLEALAEAGPPTGFPDEPGLVDELDGMVGEMGVVAAGAYTPEDTVADPNDPTGEVPGAPPIAPGGAFEFDVEVEPGQKLSFASMFVPSNDLFFSPVPGGIPLWPEDSEPVHGDVTDMVELWDAGTEPNGQPGQGPDQAPAQDSPTQGGDEDGVVRRLSAVDDGYDYPDVSDAIQVTVMRTDSMGDGMGDESMTTESMGDESMTTETMGNQTMGDGSMTTETMGDT